MNQSSTNAIRPLPDDLAERIDLAAQVFADNGLDATRIEHLAKATGIPRATLYYYFPGKEHILAHLLSRTLRQMTVKLAAAAAEPGTGRERLARLVREHLVFIGSHGPTYRLLFAELGRAASLVDIAAGVNLAILSPIREALRDGQRDGSLRVDDIGAATSIVYGAVLITGMQHLLIGSDRQLEDRAAALLDVMLSGIGTTAKPRRSRS
ncbi:MAG: TetR/AcrR family transcriptional regulator [Ilumatobacteraceae bacterium]|nr:TetR/AcrR family transcriptional regulator [Ilumatobacteraceae bacterium]